jgi:hypothetical protein
MAVIHGGVRQVNTLAWLAAIPGTLWLITWSLNTLENDYLGMGLIGLLLVEMLWIYRAMVDDLRALWRKDRGP